MANGIKRKFQSGNDFPEEGSPNKKEATNEFRHSELIKAVQSENPLGNVVVVLNETDENPYGTLQNTITAHCGNVMLNQTNDTNFELCINGQVFVTGTFPNIQLAKRYMGQLALERLKEICFFINKKPDYVNVTKQQLEKSEVAGSTRITINAPPLSINSLAHQMMLKMGWSGGGLGIDEQGDKESVVLYENVDRQGLGTNNLVIGITKKLENFSRSPNLITLVFSADFSKEDRALIHKVARRFNLKSRSTGSESRKIAVQKNFSKMDIVRELLKLGGEDGLYKLHVPTKFQHLL